MMNAMSAKDEIQHAVFAANFTVKALQTVRVIQYRRSMYNETIVSGGFPVRIKKVKGARTTARMIVKERNPVFARVLSWVIVSNKSCSGFSVGGSGGSVRYFVSCKHTKKARMWWCNVFRNDTF